MRCQLSTLLNFYYKVKIKLNKYVLLLVLLLSSCVTSDSIVIGTDTSKSNFSKINSIDNNILSINSAIKADPNDPELYILLGNQYFKNQDFGNAINNFTIAIDHDPSSYQAYNSRGQSNFLLGNYDKALLDYNVSLNIEPRFSAAYLNKASYFIMLEEYKLALTNLNSSINFNNTNFLANE